jgi:hypothetical protein
MLVDYMLVQQYFNMIYKLLMHQREAKLLILNFSSIRLLKGYNMRNMYSLNQNMRSSLSNPVFLNSLVFLNRSFFSKSSKNVPNSIKVESFSSQTKQKQ